MRSTPSTWTPRRSCEDSAEAAAAERPNWARFRGSFGSGDDLSWLDERRRTGGIDEIPLPAGSTGRLWLCGKHFIGPDVEGAMARVGATVVVCLNPEAELVDRYPQYVEWLREHAGERAIWFPIPDLHAPSPELAAPLLADLHDRLEAGESLLIHCGAGQGRAGTIAAAVLIGLGEELDDALATVAAARSLAGPEAGSQLELLQWITDIR